MEVQIKSKRISLFLLSSTLKKHFLESLSTPPKSYLSSTCIQQRSLWFPNFLSSITIISSRPPIICWAHIDRHFSSQCIPVKTFKSFIIMQWFSPVNSKMCEMTNALNGQLDPLEEDSASNTPSQRMGMSKLGLTRLNEVINNRLLCTARHTGQTCNQSLIHTYINHVLSTLKAQTRKKSHIHIFHFYEKIKPYRI